MRLAFRQHLEAYASRMVEPSTHLILTIDTREPIELGDFIAAFVGLGNQFERFAGHEHPEAKGDARFYVKEVRAGSIIAELVPYIGPAVPILGMGMAAVKHANDLVKFVENFGGRLKRYFKPNGREEDASKGDLADYLRAVVSVAHDPEGLLRLAVFEDGKQRVAFEFDTKEARQAERNIIEHQRELEKVSDAQHQRVLMIFTRTNVGHAQTGKRSGELVEISAITARALPIVYASSLAEERIRHEIAEADDNVYKKGFEVDVNVEMRGDKPIAYRIVEVHDVIDLPD